jgi:sucrose phosphorylase
MTDPSFPSKLVEKIEGLLREIYPEQNASELTGKVIESYWGTQVTCRKRARMPGNTLWSQQDNLVITYANSVTDSAYKPLDVLYSFLLDHLNDAISGVHILPFFPFTSDDGFAVTDYESVNSALGDWPDIRRIAAKFTLMSDLVLNHVSSQSKWFNDYLQGHAPYDKYFFEASPDEDLSMVVRPRAHNLLREVETPSGTKHVWCTFSHDQVDVNFANPDVLLEFIRIMRLHIDNGVRILRLDAVAFIWKEIGTNCIHLPQTHAIIRLMRVLADYSAEPLVLLTETNVPNAENLSYFGNRNEAHAIYNFSLPPLLLHALLNGSSQYLNAWQMTMPPAPLGCTFVNFTASHDGIGMRPAEGLLPPEDIEQMIATVRRFGGLVSTRKMPDGGEAPYELNISLIDAFSGTIDGPDEWQFERFICGQSIMMALEGIPAFYIHSLLATPNDTEGVEKTQHNRAINRHRWDYDALKEKLADPQSMQARVLQELTRRIAIRRQQPGFHPNATQFTLQLGTEIFGLWRQSIDRVQSIFAISNVTNAPQSLTVESLNLIEGEEWIDLLTGKEIHKSEQALILLPYQSVWISNRLG